MFSDNVSYLFISSIKIHNYYSSDFRIWPLDLIFALFIFRINIYSIHL